ncbi:MAG: hypothetical protein CMP49_02350 [Flavobacteriales bacterium]|nr:hypothetical protein [Flavobacteriales bacterium]|tara:strand:+ start:6956 stop:7705 length:750 start_codon:yes stop_codon:yes gene_type:complete
MNKLLIFFVFTSYLTLTQNNKQIGIQGDELFLSINHSFQIPSGDLANRFGNNSDLSLSLLYKKSNSLIVNFEGGAIFGPLVKEDNIFESIDGNEGVLISQNGEIPIIRLFERGARCDLSIGKFFSLTNDKYQSGIIISIGTGYMYHKILIETIVTELPQLNEELIKGYDRLCGGLLTKQFIGFMYFGNNNNIRFFLGLEAIQAFTKDLREYSYTTQEYLDENRLDYLFGLKCGFLIPIKKRNTGKYYYY